MVAGSPNFFSLSPSGFLPLSDGFTAEYYIRGEGEPLVLIPGLAGGTGLLRPLIDALSQDHRVITFELRGEKSCVCERSFHFDRLVRDLSEVVDGLALEQPGIFGLSFGGAIALDFACRSPHRVGYLAIQGASDSHENRLFEGVARKMLDRMLLPENSPFVNQFFKLLTAQRTREGCGIDFVVDQCWSTDQSVMAHRFAMLEEYDISDRLNRLRMPLLLLSGELDILTTPSDMRAFSTHAPHAELRGIPGAGHFAFVTHAGQIAEELRDFRRGVLAAL
ncbi:alpha/beta hydrolase [bacterium]|nr:alpha/beta hydrolase [bacterium]